MLKPNPYTEKYVTPYNESPARITRLKIGKEKEIEGIQKKNITYYGTELELQILDPNKTREYIIELITSAINTAKFRIIGKHDGSIGHGIEWVSNPMSISSWTYHIRRIKKLFFILEKSMAPSVKTGYHIHISIDSFIDAEHIFRFMRFFYENQPFAFAFGGRNKTQYLTKYASFDNIKIFAINDSIYTGIKNIKSVMNQPSTVSKYSAIRITDRTIEIRFPSATLNWETFIGILQGIDIIKTWTIGHDSICIPDLITWAKNLQENHLKQLWKWGVARIEKSFKKKDDKPTKEVVQPQVFTIVTNTLNYQDTINQVLRNLSL